MSDLRVNLENALRSSSVNVFSPVERQVLEEWGVTDILGDQLAHEVDRIFSENQITMPNTAQQLTLRSDRLSQLVGSLTTLTDVLPQFNASAEELLTGEFEVDVLVPREAEGINSNLSVRNLRPSTESRCRLLSSRLDHVPDRSSFDWIERLHTLPARSSPCGDMLCQGGRPRPVCL